MTDATNTFLSIDKEILSDAYASNETAEVLYALCDQIGMRFAGTDGEREAGEYIAGKLESYGLEEVTIEEFEFDAWRRGKDAHLSAIGDGNRTIPCLALPYGGTTPPDGIEGRLVDIGPGSADDVEHNQERIRNCVVLSDASGAHRSEIYGRISKAGAIGFVMSGRTPGMILPTGCVRFGAAGKIPAVGIPYESGLLLKRLCANAGYTGNGGNGGNGGVKVRLHTHDRIERATSRNVVGEIRGTSEPDEMVVVGGHMDSHDVAPGAVDNASGTTCVIECARLLARQQNALERSVRFVAFGAEEVGLLGSYHYADAHAEEMSRTRLMLNLDCLVMSRPKGLVFHHVPGAEDYVRVLREQLQEPLPFTERVHGHSDHFPFLVRGVPTAEIGGGRFRPGVNSFAHMAGDTPDKVSLMDLREESALAARLLLRASSDPAWPLKTRTREQVADLLESSGIEKKLEFENQFAD